MASDTQTRIRALSHAEYIQNLHRPSVEETRRISEIQRRRESEINQKYHTPEEHEAATTIQKAYRGHRQRRELAGLTLDPSERWVALIKEMRFRTATAPQNGPGSPRIGIDGRPRVPSDVAKRNWQRAVEIAEHAGAGDSSSPERERSAFLSVPSDIGYSESQEKDYSMLMDMRYFLEMVDQKHRYGANLLVYHEEWLRSKTDQNFFYWLERGDGRHISLPICNREKLERERIRYLSKDERKDYLVDVDDEGKLRWQKNDELITTSVEQYKDSMAGIVPKDDVDTPSFNDEAVIRELEESRHLVRRIVRSRSGSSPWPSDVSEGSESDVSEILSSSAQHSTGKNKARKRLVVSPATILNQLLRASVKPGTWIYVADTVGRLYVGIKSSGTFQHASFLSGGRISSAGSIGIENGQLTYLSPLSGHYRPTTKSFRIFIKSLKNQGVDMSQMRVSGAFKILLGMEYYGKVRKIGKHKKDEESERKKSPELNQQSQVEMGVVSAPSEISVVSATGEVERNWDREHRRGLAKLMDDLHIRRRSSDIKKETL